MELNPKSAWELPHLHPMANKLQVKTSLPLASSKAHRAMPRIHAVTIPPSLKSFLLCKQLLDLPAGLCLLGTLLRVTNTLAPWQTSWKRCFQDQHAGSGKAQSVPSWK